jgi:protein-tyrosine-phosphatase
LGKKVVFVCTGNTCRSPMAAGLMRDAASRLSLDLEVQSAGIAAFPGVPYTQEAIEALQEKGIDISGGVSQPLSKTLVMEADVLLTMTPEHRDAILRKLPMLQEKVFLLSDFVGEGETPVVDPVGQDLDTYRKVREQLEGYVLQALERLKD